MNQFERTDRIADRARTRSKVRAITAGTVVAGAAGAIALTVVLSGHAAAENGPGAPVTDRSTAVTNGSGLSSDGGSSTDGGSSSGSGGQQLSPGQQPQSGGGGSHAGSGGS